MLKIMVLGLILVIYGTRTIEASFLDDFEDPDLVSYTDSNSHGGGGRFEISGGKLNIITGSDNTFSVMTSEAVEFAIGATLSLEVPAVSGYEGVFMICSTTAAQPDPNGAGTFGFRFRRDGDAYSKYARMHLYPGSLQMNTLDPDPDKPATLCIKRISDTDFDYSIKIEGNETALGSFTLSELAGIINLHIGAQAFDIEVETFSFDNLKIDSCGDWGYHSMDFNRDCYVNSLDFAMFAGSWLECTMPGEPGCVENVPFSFSIVILPDTQLYSENDPDFIPDPCRPCSRKEVFTQMTTWIVHNIEELNIKFVLHMGDIVNADEEPDQWINADEALSILDGVIPYSLVVGNHDMKKGVPSYLPDPNRNTMKFNETFPYTRYVNEPWYGGCVEDPNGIFGPNDDGFHPSNDYDNAYHYFRAAGMNFLVLTLENGPTDAMLAWADSVISGHPNHRVILTTHSYLKQDNNLDGCFYLPDFCCSQLDANCVIDVGLNCSNTGKNIWDKLVKCHDNIDFVFSGHQNPLDSPNHRGLRESYGYNGNRVYQFLCGEWYDGWLKILTFVPEEDKVYVKTYSPWEPDDPSQQCFSYQFSLPGYNTDPNFQYELDYDMN